MIKIDEAERDEILKQCEKMCDKYCKYPNETADNMICENCPLNDILRIAGCCE